jgi:hypothetical protein
MPEHKTTRNPAKIQKLRNVEVKNRIEVLPRQIITVLGWEVDGVPDSTRNCKKQLVCHHLSVATVLQSPQIPGLSRTVYPPLSICKFYKNRLQINSMVTRV